MTAAPVLPMPSPATMNVEVRQVNPALAEKWLGKNPRNRHIAQRVVAGYVRAMKAGEWLLTGEAIKIAYNGDLLDGQHRLTAIVQSGKSVPMLVVTGLAPDVQDVLDTGKARTAGDVLSIHGHRHTTLTAASARIVILYERGMFYRDTNAQQVSHRQILDFATGNHLLAHVVQRASLMRSSIEMRPSSVAAAMHTLIQVDDQAAIEFFDRLRDGANLTAKNPILALRQRLRNLRDERSSLSMEANASLLYRTWNAWRAGRQLTSLQLYRNGELIACPVPK